MSIDLYCTHLQLQQNQRTLSVVFIHSHTQLPNKALHLYWDQLGMGVEPSTLGFKDNLLLQLNVFLLIFFFFTTNSNKETFWF